MVQHIVKVSSTIKIYCLIALTLQYLLLLSWLSTADASTFSWIDPDTPRSAYTTMGSSSLNNNQLYHLVFSDEFNVPNRTFRDGEDPRWKALHRNDMTNNPLHYYDHNSVFTTDEGRLNITTRLHPRQFDDEYKEIQSGMLQSWNKFCFIGGILEVSAILPGSPSVGGLWPAAWMMGNLARATYVDSSERLWPFSTNVCDNRTKKSQLINSCPSAQEERYGLPHGRGRGAPEVDLFEVMYLPIFQHPLLSVSLQIAPGIENNRPVPGHAPNRVSCATNKISSKWLSFLIHLSKSNIQVCTQNIWNLSLSFTLSHSLSFIFHVSVSKLVSRSRIRQYNFT